MSHIFFLQRERKELVIESFCNEVLERSCEPYLHKHTGSGILVFSSNDIVTRTNLLLPISLVKEAMKVKTLRALPNLFLKS